MMKERSRLFIWLRGVVITLALVAVLVPLLYLLLNSVKIEREFRSIPLRIILA